MAVALSGQQLLTLSKRFTDLQSAIEAYGNKHAGEPGFDSVALQDIIGKLDTLASNLANDGLNTLFDDSQQTYADLVSVTDKAKAAATSLNAERNQFARIAGIGAAFVQLATSIGSGNAASVFGAIATCAKAIKQA